MARVILSILLLYGAVFAWAQAAEYAELTYTIELESDPSRSAHNYKFRSPDRCAMEDRYWAGRQGHQDAVNDLFRQMLWGAAVKGNDMALLSYLADQGWEVVSGSKSQSQAAGKPEQTIRYYLLKRE